jgi:hypothetical protein
MIIASEQEKKSVATEFQVAATVVAGNIEHESEVVIDDTCEPLCSFLPEFGQPLRHAREAGDVRKN